MGKPTHVARYFADDKDVFDLLSQSSITIPRLRNFLRKMGIVVSPGLSKEDVCRYFQVLPLAWPQLESLLAILERADREEKYATCRIEAKETDIDKAAAAAAVVQDSRGNRFGEVYRVEKLGTGGLQVTVAYTEPDLTKTRLLQKEDKTLVIRLEKEGDHFKVRYHESNRALEIVELLEEQLMAGNINPEKRQEIVVSGLSSTQRSKFFIEMARGISGYQLKDERGLQVDRPQEEEEEEENDEEGNGVASTKKEKDKFHGLVKRALLHGTGLLMSPEYQDYAKNGYSISKLIWTVEPNDPLSSVVEFAAEFRDGERGAGFRYGVLGKFEPQRDGSFAKSRTHVIGTERDRLLSLLEASAYSALEQVTAPSGSGTPPTKPETS